MEWSSDFHHFSPLDESLYGLLSPPPPVEMPRPHEWTREENKLFENALAEIDPTSPAFFENIAAKVPWKSIQEIKVHYEALVHDIEMIESGNFPVPDYPTMNAVRKEKMEGKKKKNVASPSKEGAAKTKSGQPRRRGVPWTEEEHQLFLMGLNKYGKGDWRSISRYYVITKTPTQVASHAQKYFRRQNSTTPADRRRPSIHDIHTVNPATAAAATAAFTSPVPAFPTLHHTYGGHVLEQNPPFMPIVNSTFPVAPAHVFNQANAYNMNPLPSCYFPSLRNQHWG
ncbi:Duplicated homeodomain-like superfamily protein [Perilla frutescens var. hirtella]|uniref:Duplicated homeodomain-like superfamily protein n=1 Tax=Perilla frutescens var. hirtella TaxID=608512 RepID=A0AAD4PF16_PERFH|nr:Duplicated homeodomain-like superfamily protein [Perilla frutescens var. hirtella]KAH6807997.1 Duplicated homeodomain-like superfamily protein [Perilla frutescens var. frutescens]KAH6837593.1 Duplicated homeodomain-like superfamily protein [Perilla frutescens var. hirtella]